ncbi:MAG: prenyltransferase, partial [Firmicutes bacterium]|nr:prenyltransferase [Bacillota bacterium]
MTEPMVHSIPQRLKALYTLIRILPVLSWGISSSLVGLGFAYSLDNKVNWFNYGLIILFIVLVHGVLSHAFNDREDWLSGTDQLSPGILSGGSGVIANQQYSLDELSLVGKAAILTATIIALYFTWQIGPSILFFLAIAFWSAIAYSCAPLKLSYHPFVGEWLCGFPAVFGCAVGTFYVLTNTVTVIILIAGTIQALLAIGLLMHHHLSDISSDLQATPRKLTTVAWVRITLGMAKTTWVEFVYFLLALLLGVIGILFFHPVFWVTILVALGCMAVALTTLPEDIPSITAKEYLLYALIIGDAVIKTALLFLWRGLI